MAISIRKYVDITSGVGGGASVATRELGLRIFSGNAFISPDSVLSFSEAANVAEYFGSTSEEYKQALQYFSYLSPNTTRPRKVQFAAMHLSGIDPAVIGNNDFKSASAISAITAGVLVIRLGGNPPVTLGGINFTGLSTLSAIAGKLQTELRTLGGVFTTALVSFGSAGPTRFVITIPDANAKPSIIAAPTGDVDVGAALGLREQDGAIDIAQGLPSTITECFIRSEQVSDNFGSFVTIARRTLEEVEELAQYNATQNIKYQYHVPVAIADLTAWSTALQGYAGTGLTLAPITTEYPHLLPCSILASVRYDLANSVTGYMYRQVGNLTPSVSSTITSDKYDKLRINYYGDTSSAGQQIAFYQRGFLMGGATAPIDMGTYGNEQWLKDAILAALLSLQLSVGRIPANDQGRASCLSIIQGQVNRALNNGTISVGKPLTDVQKVYIGEQTGDPTAWQTVNTVGYVLSANIEQFVSEAGVVEFKIVYTLIYAKDDQIRKIEGFNRLI